MKKRMFKTHIIVIIYILSPFTSFAQLSNFYKIYPFISETYFIDIDTTHDGGYVACGQTYGPNGGDFVVLKTDSVGNELWRFENNEFDGNSIIAKQIGAIPVKLIILAMMLLLQWKHRIIILSLQVL